MKFFSRKNKNEQVSVEITANSNKTSELPEIDIKSIENLSSDLRIRIKNLVQETKKLDKEVKVLVTNK